MKFRVIAAVFVTGLLLGGCSSWNDAMSYVGLRDSDEATPPPAAPADAAAPPANAATAASPPDSTSESWCKQVAQAASRDAAESGFDAATQRRQAETVYKQCAGSPAP